MRPAARVVSLFLYRKLVFAHKAEGALKIFGKIFPLGAGCNAVFGRALFFVLFPTAYIAYVCHIKSS